MNCILLSEFFVDVLIIINLATFSTCQPSFDQLKYIEEVFAII